MGDDCHQFSRRVIVRVNKDRSEQVLVGDKQFKLTTSYKTGDLWADLEW